MINSTSLVSVIMSVYNGETYLAKSIESILSQSYSNLEFIIVNDGSIDNSIQIINDYKKKDNRIKVINQENIGLAISLNKAIKYSNGKYIARFDADDISLPNRLEKQIQYLETHNDYIMVSSSAYFIDKNDKIYGRTCPLLSERLLLKQLKYINPIIHPSVVIRKDALEKVGLYDENIKQICEDYYLWNKLSKTGKIKVLFTPLIKFRMHNNNMSNSNHLLKFRKEISAFVKKDKISKIDYINLINTINKTSKEKYKYNNKQRGLLNKIVCNSITFAFIYSFIKTILFSLMNDKQIQKIYFK